jgi:hypothetical protein
MVGIQQKLVHSILLMFIQILLQDVFDDECMFTIVVNPLPTVTLVAYEPVCEGSDEFELYGGLPEGGMYYVDGVEATSFNPLMAGTYMLEYMYTDGNGCSNTAMGEIVVLELPEVTCPGNFIWNIGDDPLTLTGGLPEGGTYSGAGVVDGVFFVEEEGTYEITYTVIGGNGCENSCPFFIIVGEGCLDAEIMNFPETLPDVCEGSGTVINFIDVMFNNTVSTEWFVEPEEAGFYAGVDFFLNDAYTGMVTLSVIAYAEEPCQNATASVSFMVNPLPVAECPVIEPVCAESEYIMFPEVEGGVYTDMDGNVVEGLDPMVADTYMFTLTVTNEFDCVATCDFTVVVNPLPVADCPVIEPVCAESEYIMFPEVEGGVYTDMDGNVVDGLDPMVADTYMFTLTVTNEFECSASCDFEVVVNPLPVADCPVIEPVCAESEYIMFPEVVGGVYTDMDGNVVDGLDPMVADTYMFTLTVTNEFDCVATCDFEVVVNPLPVAECPVVEPVCAESEYIMFPEVEGGVYTDMDGNVVDGLDPMVADTYMFTLTVSNEFDCSASCDFEVVVNPLPEFECPYFEVCEGSDYIEFDAMEGYVYTDADGNVVSGFDPASCR